MNVGNRSNIEFLQDVQSLESFKKELVLRLEKEEKSFSIYYKYYPFPREIFSIFFKDLTEFLKTKKLFKKWKKYKLVISETHWISSAGELKEISGEKIFIECQLIDIRKDFLKVKIIL